MTVSEALEVTLLGRPSFREGARVHAVPPGKALGLLSYLALRGAASRSQLAGLLWSEMNEEAARKYLRQLLYKLRAGPLGAWLEVDEASVAVRPGLRCDVLRFQALLEEGRRAEALRLYRGPLLDGESFAGAPAFEDWLEEERERWALLWRAALAQEARTREEGGQWHEALELCLILLREDALQEVHQRSVMRLHALLGQREAALEAFERFRQTLNRELRLSPLPETFALVEEIASGRLSPAPVAAAPRPSVPPAPVPAGPKAHAGLPPAPLTGREEATAWLEARLCASGSEAQLVLLVGEPGVGKTRLGEEFWGARGGCLMLPAQELTRDTPLAPVATALRRALASTTGSPTLPSLDEVWRREAARLVPELSPGESPDPPTHEGRARFLEGLARALAACEVPLLADDLHWFDPASLEVLGVYLGLPSAGPLLATARAAELHDHPRLDAWLSRLTRERRLSRLLLDPLGEPEVRQLVQRMSGSGGAVRFCRRLHQATAGNPLFVLETLRDLQSSGLLEVAEGGWHTPFDASTEDYAELPLPPSVREAVLGRIARLGAAPRRLLEAASLAGDDFALDWLSGATALSEWESLEALEVAVQAGLLAEGSAGYRFAHDLHRRALVGSLGSERRSLLHRRLASMLEARGAEPARVAGHLEQGGRPAEAVAWRVRAAQQAEAVYAHDQALAHYDQALANGATPEQTYAVLLAREQLLFYANDTEGQRRALDALRSLAAAATDPLVWGEVSVRWARLHMNLGAYVPVLEETAHALERLRVLPDRSGLAALIAELLHLRIEVLWRLRRLEETEQHLEEALALGRERLPTALLTTLLTSRTYLLMEQGRREEALVQCEEVEALSRQQGQRRRHAITLNLRARLLMLGGDVEAAATALEEALDISRAQRHADLQKAFLLNMSELYLRLQRLDRARAALEDWRRLLGDDPSARDQAVSQSHLARVLWAQGEKVAAAEALRRAITAYDATDERHQQGKTRLLLARYLFVLGHRDEARVLLDEARSLVREDATAHLALAAEEARALLPPQPTQTVERLEPLVAAYLPSDHWKETAQYVLAEAYLTLAQPGEAKRCLENVERPLHFPAEHSVLWNRMEQVASF